MTCTSWMSGGSRVGVCPEWESIPCFLQGLQKWGEQFANGWETEIQRWDRQLVRYPLPVNDHLCMVSITCRACFRLEYSGSCLCVLYRLLGVHGCQSNVRLSFINPQGVCECVHSHCLPPPWVSNIAHLLSLTVQLIGVSGRQLCCLCTKCSYPACSFPDCSTVLAILAKFLAVMAKFLASLSVVGTSQPEGRFIASGLH